MVLGACAYAQPSANSSFFAPLPGSEEDAFERSIHEPPHYLPPFDPFSQTDREQRTGLTLELLNSETHFLRSDLLASINALKHIEERTDGLSPLRFESSLLFSLEILSKKDLEKAEIEHARELLASIPDSAFEHYTYLRAERHFWLAECYRLQKRHALADEYYSHAISIVAGGDFSALARIRRSEILEKTGDLQGALTELDSVAHGGHSTMLALHASLKRISLLLGHAMADSLPHELSRADSLSKKTFLITDNTVHEQYHSLFLEWLNGKQSANERIIVYNGMNAVATDSMQAQAASAYHRSLMEFFHGMTFSYEHELHSAENSFSRADSLRRMVKDSSSLESEENTFLTLAIRYERAWAYFDDNKNQLAADEFLALSKETFPFVHSHAPGPTLREHGRLGDPFYEEVTDSGNHYLGDNNNYPISEYFYYDIPARSRYYAAIALSRSGNSEEARKQLTDLAQDPGALYSDRASYHLALVELRAGRTFHAEELLKPLALKRTQSGVYSSLLLGDLLYRRSSYATASQHLGFALANLPAKDSTLRSYAYFIRGLSFLSLGLWRESANDLANFVASEDREQKTKGLDEALFWLGRAYLRADSNAQAAQCFGRILKDYPSSERTTDAEYGYAWTLFKNGDYDQAEKAFAHILEIDSISRYAYDALSRRGDAFYAKGEISKALKTYNLAVDRPTFNKYLVTRAMFQLGLARMRSDSVRSAMNAFNYIVTKYPTSDILDRAYYNYAISAYGILQNAKAEEAVKALAEKFPSSAYSSKGLLLMGMEAERNNENAKAVVAYKRILKEHPNSPEFGDALFNSVDLLASSKKYSDAIALCDSYLGEDSSDAKKYLPELLLKKGKIEFAAAKYDDATATFTSFPKRFPNDTLIPFSYYYLGRSQTAAGFAEKGHEYYLSTIDSFPSSDAASFAYLELARGEKKATHKEKAAEYYTKAFSWQYYSSDAAPEAMYEYAGYMRNTIGDQDSAVSIYAELTRRYLIETSVGAKAQLETSEILLAKGKRNDALAGLEKVANAHAGDQLAAESQLGMASIHRMERAYKKALEEYDNARSQSLTPDQMGRSLLGSAEMLIATGNKAKAGTRLHTLISSRGIPSEYRARGEDLWEKLHPKKKTSSKHRK